MDKSRSREQCAPQLKLRSLMGIFLRHLRHYFPPLPPFNLWSYLFSSLQRCCTTTQAPDGTDLLDRWAKHCKLMGAQTTPSTTSYLMMGIRDQIVTEPRRQCRWTERFWTSDARDYKTTSLEVFDSLWQRWTEGKWGSKRLQLWAAESWRKT